VEDELVQLDVREETGEHVVADQSRPDISQPARVSISAGVDVAGHQVVQHGVPQELQLLIASSQPVVSIAWVIEGLEEERLLLERVSGDLLDLVSSQLIPHLVTAECILLSLHDHLFPGLLPLDDLLHPAIVLLKLIPILAMKSRQFSIPKWRR
jgi:hypothetical protein